MTLNQISIFLAFSAIQSAFEPLGKSVNQIPGKRSKKCRSSVWLIAYISLGYMSVFSRLAICLPLGTYPGANFLASYFLDSH